MDKFLFDDIIEYPDPESQEKYESLIGVDPVKKLLIKESEIMLKPMLLNDWSLNKYGKVIPLVKIFKNRHSLFILAGDVGTGKTTLAESFGDELARQNNMHITLFSLSLRARGTGSAGEITKYLSQAFDEVKRHLMQLRTPDGNYTSTCILLVDEADALAESRDTQLMYHEDKAGVNSLIQGVDMISKMHVPVIIVLCTNRLDAIDPAIRRRAAAIFELHRPTEEQRYLIFKKYLEGTNVNEEDIKILSKLTGENDSRNYAYTYSDIIRKVLPALVLETYPSEEIARDKIVYVLEKISPTPPLNLNNHNH